jgi:predicted P-loop ATPase
MTLAPPQPAATASMLDWALWYAALGWPVFPCRGKRPITEHGLSEASTDPEQIRQWWKHTPSANIATALDAGRWALDVDARSDGLETLHDLEQAHSPLPRTVTNLTGSGGGSCHYLWAGEAENKANLGSGIDVQGPGSYIILPPSRHPTTRKRYVWEADYGPDDLEVQPAPAWLAALVHPSAAKPPAAPLDPDEPIRQGQREKTLLRLAGAMRRVGTPFVAIRAALEAENARCEPPLPGKDLDRLAKSVERYAPAVEKNGQGSPGSPAQEEGQPPRRFYATSWRNELFYKGKKSDELTQNLFNITKILENHAYWEAPEHQLWWDSVRGTPMCGDTEITDIRMMDIATWFGATERLPITSPGVLEKCVIAKCKTTPRDLLQMWLNGLPGWDGTPRLRTWLHDIAGMSLNPYTEEVSQVLITSMVARAMQPGCHYRFVVILEGAQELGKSTLVRELASPEWYVELSIGLETKEAHMMLQGAWVAELSELDSLSRTEETRLKAFITMREDSYVPKYSNFRQRTERRCIFVGTTNDDTYIKDQTGGTRYLPLLLPYPIDLPLFRALRTQLFAEAMHYYHDHPEDYWQLSPEAMEIAKVEREERRVGQVYEGPIEEWLEDTRWRKSYYDSEQRLVTFTRDETSWQEIASCYFAAEPERWKDKSLQMQVTASLKALGWQQRTVKKGGRTVKIWRKTPPVPF